MTARKAFASCESMRHDAECADVREMCREAVRNLNVLQWALRDANAVPQLMVHAQLTGDTSLLEKAAPYIEGGWAHMARLPDALKAEVADALTSALKSVADGSLRPRPPVPADIARLLSAGVNALVPDDYGDMFFEEAAPAMGRMRSTEWRRKPNASSLTGFRVLIAGAGLSGICMGIMLKRAGIPFDIIERNDDLGGTWYENAYPGAGVDIPNHVYSFSFFPQPNWDRVFGLRDELLSYVKDVADAFDIRSHIRFSSEVVGAEFDTETSMWRVTVRSGTSRAETLTGNVFVPAVGSLNRPAIPNIPGLDTFGGPMFHTARWDHSVDLKGKRVALVGTGASSVQVGPTIAPDVSDLLIFQRTPGWVGVNLSYHTRFGDGMKWANAHIPYYYMWCRFLLFWASGDVNHPLVQVDPTWDKLDVSMNARSHALREIMINYIKGELADRPDLFGKVVPDFPPWGKRMLRDNNWFKTLMRENVRLVASEVASVEPGAVIDGNGERHPVDVLIMATGFKATEVLAPMHIVGRTGRSVNELWAKDGARAYMGMTVPEFPNMFVLGGPNTGLSHGGGIFFYAEIQVRYVMQCLREMIEGNHAAVEVRQVVHDEYNRRVDEMHARMVWAHSSAKNWYKNQGGRVVALAPWRIVDFWKMTKALNPDDFIFNGNLRSNR